MRVPVCLIVCFPFTFMIRYGFGAAVITLHALGTILSSLTISLDQSLAYIFFRHEP